MKILELGQRYFAAAWEMACTGHYDWCVFASSGVLAASEYYFVHSNRKGKSERSLERFRREHFVGASALLMKIDEIATGYRNSGKLPTILVVAGLYPAEDDLAYFYYTLEKTLWERIAGQKKDVTKETFEQELISHIRFFIYDGVPQGQLLLEGKLCKRVKRYRDTEANGPMASYALPCGPHTSAMPTIWVEAQRPSHPADLVRPWRNQDWRRNVYQHFEKCPVVWRANFEVSGLGTLKCFVHEQKKPNLIGLTPYVYWTARRDELGRRLAQSLRETDTRLAPIAALLEKSLVEDPGFADMLMMTVLSFAMFPRLGISKQYGVMRHGDQFALNFGTIDELGEAFQRLGTLKMSDGICSEFFSRQVKLESAEKLLNPDIGCALVAIEESLVHDDVLDASSLAAKRRDKVPYLPWSEFDHSGGMYLGVFLIEDFGGTLIDVDLRLAVLTELLTNGYVGFRSYRTPGGAFLDTRGILRGPGVAPVALYLPALKKLYRFCKKNGLGFDGFAEILGERTGGPDRVVSISTGGMLRRFAERLDTAGLTPLDLWIPHDLTGEIIGEEKVTAVLEKIFHPDRRSS